MLGFLVNYKQSDPAINRKQHQELDIKAILARAASIPDDSLLALTDSYLKDKDKTRSVQADSSSLFLLHTLRGEIYYKKERCSDAIQEVRHAFKYVDSNSVSAEYSDAYMCLARSSACLKMNTDANYYYSRAILLEGQKYDTLKYTQGVLEWNKFQLQNQLSAGADEDVKSIKSALIHFSNPKKAHKQIQNHAFDLQDIGLLPDALLWHRVALAIASANNQERNMASSLLAIGYIKRINGQVDSTMVYYQKALNLFSITKDSVGVASTLIKIGLVKYHTGDLDSAIAYYDESIKIAWAVGDSNKVAAANANLGNVYSQKGEYAKAIACQMKSMELNSKLNQMKSLAKNYGNLAGIYMELNMLDKSLEYYHKALNGFKELDDQFGKTISYQNIAIIHSKKGQYSTCLNYSDSAYAISQSIGDIAGLVASEENRGFNYKSLMMIDSSKVKFANAISLSRQLGDSTLVIQNLVNLALVNMQEKNYKDAKLNAHYAFKLSRNSGYRNGLLSSCEILVGVNYLTNNTDSVIFYINEGNRVVEDDLRNEIHSLIEAEKTGFLGGKQRFINLSITMAYNLKNSRLSTQSGNHLLLYKSIGIRSINAIRNELLQKNDTALITMYSRWNALQKVLSSMEPTSVDFMEYNKVKSEYERKLVTLSQEFGSIHSLKSISSEKVHKALKAGEAAIDFVCYNRSIFPDSNPEPRYGAFLYLKGTEEIRFIDLCSENKLDSILNPVTDGYNFAPNLIYGYQKLYETIWEPIQKSLIGIERLFISPDGLLHTLNFNAIRNPSGMHLCELYVITQLTSTAEITLRSDRDTLKLNTVFLCGGLSYNLDQTDRTIWSFLPGTKFEIEGIDSLFKQKNITSTLLTDLFATEINVKTKVQGKSILHFSTHGFFFPNKAFEEVSNYSWASLGGFNTSLIRGTEDYFNVKYLKVSDPLKRSGLILSGANHYWNDPGQASEMDGVLTAAEISGLDLSESDLVVLSACETGLGDIKNAEGIFGLQRGFKLAGTSKLLVSLWKVPDMDTKRFMLTFYKHILQDRSVNESFRLTQRELLDVLPPHSWAAFILIE